MIYFINLNSCKLKLNYYSKFTKLEAMTAHIKIKHATPKERRINCDICNYKFGHTDQEQKHIQEEHPNELIVCKHACGKVFSSEEKMKKHVCRNRSRIFFNNIIRYKDKLYLVKLVTTENVN